MGFRLGFELGLGLKVWVRVGVSLPYLLSYLVTHLPPRAHYYSVALLSDAPAAKSRLPSAPLTRGMCACSSVAVTAGLESTRWACLERGWG